MGYRGTWRATQSECPFKYPNELAMDELSWPNIVYFPFSCVCLWWGAMRTVPREGAHTYTLKPTRRTWGMISGPRTSLTVLAQEGGREWSNDCDGIQSASIGREARFSNVVHEHEWRSFQ